MGVGLGISVGLGLGMGLELRLRPVIFLRARPLLRRRGIQGCKAERNTGV